MKKRKKITVSWQQAVQIIAFACALGAYATAEFFLTIANPEKITPSAVGSIYVIATLIMIFPLAIIIPVISNDKGKGEDTNEKNDCLESQCKKEQ